MIITGANMNEFLKGTGIPEVEWGDIKTSHMFEWGEFRSLMKDNKHHSLENQIFYITSFEINSTGEIQRDIPPQMTYGMIGGRYNRDFYFAKTGKQGQKLKSTIAILNPKGYELIVCKTMEQAEKSYNHLLTLANKKIEKTISGLESKMEEFSLKKVKINI